MIHRHPVLYQVLSLAFLVIALVLFYLGVVAPWPSTARAVTFILALFSAMLSLSYFWVEKQEEQGIF